MKEDTEITLDTLAQMVARGFESVHEEIGGLRVAVNRIDEELGGLKEDVADLQVTVDRIDKRTQNQVDAVYSDMHAIEGRVEILEKEKA